MWLSLVTQAPNPSPTIREADIYGRQSGAPLAFPNRTAERPGPVCAFPKSSRLATERHDRVGRQRGMVVDAHNARCADRFSCEPADPAACQCLPLGGNDDLFDHALLAQARWSKVGHPPDGL